MAAYPRAAQKQCSRTVPLVSPCLDPTTDKWQSPDSKPELSLSKAHMLKTTEGLTSHLIFVRAACLPPPTVPETHWLSYHAH